MRPGLRFVVLAAAVVASLWSASPAVAETPQIKLSRVAQPAAGTALAARPGDRAVYVAEQVGTVRVLRDGDYSRAPVLDLRASVSSGGERGLLGLAFSPDGRFLYVDYTNKSGDTEIVEFAMRGRQIDTDSRRLVLTVAQPQPNHNGGQLAFGPDELLYVALGDGGAGGDQGPGHAPGGNAQALDTLLGKILRIDPRPSGDAPYRVPADNPFVTQRGARGEIWAYGLRNPWRFSFDRETGDLWIGDVGQSEWEEIDVARATDGRNAGRGLNFGWNRLEGTHAYTGSPPPNDVLPVYEYSHDDGSCSVTGGFRYRGTRIPSLRGNYLFIDFCTGKLTALAPTGNRDFDAVALGITIPGVSSFGQRNNGELYVLSQTTGLFAIEDGGG